MSSRTEVRDGRWSVLLAATLAVAAVLRFVGLDSGLWYDEIVTLVVSVRLPVREIVTTFPDVNVHPLYSLLAHAAIAAFGESAWTLRLPACVFGIASIAMADRVGRLLLTRREAWAGAAILTTAYHHVWFSQNARGYTLLAFFTMLSTGALLQAAESGRPRHYVVYVLACVAGVYTHLTMAFVVAGQAAAVAAGSILGWPPLGGRRLAPLAWGWTAAGVLSAALYVPYIDGLTVSMTSETSRTAAQVATMAWAIGEGLRSALTTTGAPGTVVLIGCAGLGLARLWRSAPLAVALLLLPAVVTAVGFAAFGQPIRPRHFFFLSGAVAIVAGRGIGTMASVYSTWRRPSAGRADDRAMVALTAGVVVLLAIALPANYQRPKQDFAAAVAFLDAAEAGGAEVVAAGPACLPVQEYFERSWPCLMSMNGSVPATAPAAPLLVIYTLADYIIEPDVRAALSIDCPEVARFTGTLGGGHIVVCEAGPVIRASCEVCR